MKDYKSYKNLAKGAPAMIMSNGLMPTMAFFHSKGKEHHEQLLADILVWLSKEFAMPNDYAAMMNALFHAKSDKYRRAIDETMQMLRWLRQFADTGEDQSGDQS